jgi:hypothetical protein
MKKSMMLIGVAAITLFIISTATAVPVTQSETVIQEPCFGEQSQTLPGFGEQTLPSFGEQQIPSGFQDFLNLIDIEGFRAYFTSVGFANIIKSPGVQNIFDSVEFSNLYNYQKTSELINGDAFQNFLNSDEAQTFLENYFGNNWQLYVTYENMIRAILFGLTFGILTWIPAIFFYVPLAFLTAMVGFFSLLANHDVFTAMIGALGVFFICSSLGFLWPIWQMIEIYYYFEGLDEKHSQNDPTIQSTSQTRRCPTIN